MLTNHKRIFSVFLVVVLVLLSSACSLGKVMSEEAADMFVPQNVQKQVPDGGTKVHFIQLTNGEASLVQLENGEHILIDTGSESSYPELIDYLKDQQVKRIKHLILTNEKEEHSGNLKALTEAFPIENIYFPYHSERSFVERAPLEQVKLHPLVKQKEVNFDSMSKLKVLNPGKDLSLSPQDHSLVFQLSVGKTIFLFTSSITDKIEKDLLTQFNLHSHILKVSDFGSNQASASVFLEKVDAHVAIIFHRPGYYLDSEVLERLQESWMDVYPLRDHGHIIIVCEKDDYELFVVPTKKDF